MTGIFIGVYGVFLLAVGINGQGKALFSLLSEDGKKFLPWLFALIVISVLAEFEETKRLVKPFVVLLALNFFLRNYDKLESEAKRIYNMSQK